jgi:hypothetical protein
MLGVPAEVPGNRWEPSEIITIAICGFVGAIGGLLGVLSGASQGGSVISKILTSLIQGAGSAAIFGIAALLAVTVASLMWVIASNAARRSWQTMRGGLR